MKPYSCVAGLLPLLMCMSAVVAGTPDDQAHEARTFLSSLVEEQKAPGIQYVFVDADEN